MFIVSLLCALSYAQTELDVTQVQADVAALVSPLELGEYSVCDYHVDEGTPLYGKTVTVDGTETDSLDKSIEDLVIQGVLCDSTTSVVLLFDESGLSGRIGVEIIITAQSPEKSIIDRAPQRHEIQMEDHQKGALGWLDQQEDRFNAYMDELIKTRRHLSEPLAYGSVDINIHLEIDAAMTLEFTNQGEHTDFKATKYAVDLIAVVNEDVFKPAGFNLRVTSMNVRTEFMCEDHPCEWPLELIVGEPIPEAADIYFLMTSAYLGGGVAWLGGIWDGNGYGMCGGIDGNFDFWDRKCVAHEIGHILGGVHTHDLGLDTCDVCQDNEDPVTNAPQEGTIMSYCQHCEDGYFNIKHEFAADNVVRLQAAYEDNKAVLTPHNSCGSMSEEGLPTLGLAFWMKTDSYDCVHVGDSPECITWQYDPDRKLVYKTGGQYDECWKAKDDCSGIIVERCPSYALGQNICTWCEVPAEFEFEAKSEGFYSAMCDMDRYAGGVARARDGKIGFMGADIGEAVVDFCVGEIDVSDDMYECPEGPQPLQCGQTITGKTNVYCMEHDYELTLPSDAVSVHVDTCGSHIDSELYIKDANTGFKIYEAFSRYSYVDSGTQEPPQCVLDAQTTAIADTSAAIYGMDLDTSKTYHVQVKGWCTTVGAYTLQVVCEDGSGNNMGPTAAPTDVTDTTTFHPSKAPTNNEWFVATGDCDVQLPNCVSSKNYPDNYGRDESCTITMLQDVIPSLQEPFDVIANDYLRVNGDLLQDREQVPERINADEEITWDTRYGRRRGWQLCFSEAPTTTTRPGPNFEGYCQYEVFRQNSICEIYDSSWNLIMIRTGNVRDANSCGEIAALDRKEYFTYDAPRKNCWVPLHDAYEQCVTDADNNNGMKIYKTTCTDGAPPPSTPAPSSEGGACTYELHTRGKVCDPYGGAGLNYHASTSLEDCAKIAEADGKRYFSHYNDYTFCYMPKGDAFETCVTNPSSQYSINVYELVGDCFQSETAWTIQSTMKAFVPFTWLLALVGVATVFAHLCTRGKTYVPITAEDEI